MSCSYTVKKEDVQVREMLAALIDRTNRVSRHLRPRFRQSFRGALNAYTRSGVLTETLINELLAELNHLIHSGTTIYDAEAFADACVTDYTMKLLSSAPTRMGIRRLNRLLLAEAYPCGISTSIPPRTRKWHKWQVDKFEKLRPRYECYAEMLKSILDDVRADLSPMGMVDARPKDVSRFAEKAWRKPKYINPICQITDLCGARVITETEEEAGAFCEFVRSTFIIDEVNSVDKRSELRCDEFGYLAVHFVVKIDPKRLPQIPAAALEPLLGLKAEIQVKTILGHAWASISHDRVYKSDFKVPEPLKRDLHRVAALLEDADRAFGQAIRDLEKFKCYYGAYMTRQEMEKEIETLQTVLEHEPDLRKKPSTALRIARLHKANWNWVGVKRALNPYIRMECVCAAEVLAEHGHALCWINRNRVSSVEQRRYAKGQAELEEAARTGSLKCRLQALIYLGWSFGHIRGQSVQARDAYHKALELDPSDPYVISSYIEFEMSVTGGHIDPKHIRPMLKSAIPTCRCHAEAGIEMPWAYLTMGRFYLLLGDYLLSLEAYAAGIQQCLPTDPKKPEDNPLPVDILERERDFLRNINPGRDLPVQHQWVDKMLVLAIAVKTGNLGEVLSSGIPHGTVKVEPGWPRKLSAASRQPARLATPRPIVIVAGGAADSAFQGREHAYRLCLYDAFDGFRGRIISGGTRAGVPGLVGEISERLGAKNAAELEVAGYRPLKLPPDAPEDDRYTEFRITGNPEFSVGDPLDTWFDLIASGVHPSEVRLLGINGGEITMSEYVLALALGATVAVIQASGRAASELAADAWMFRPGSVVWLPVDDASVRAFVNPGQPDPDVDWESLGEVVHSNYVESNKYGGSDLNMRPWAKLREDLKASNIEQAQYCVEILKRFGYGVRPSADPSPPPGSFESHNEEMARLEHGRWVAERLRSGWQYGPVKNVEKKINPSLVPWEELPETTKDYDRIAVAEWPGLLETANLEIY